MVYILFDFHHYSSAIKLMFEVSRTLWFSTYCDMDEMKLELPLG